MPELSQILEARIAYQVPDMELVDVEADNIYKIAEGEALMFDLYRPLDAGTKLLPAVILIHGEGPPDLLKSARSWGQYVSWGQLISKSGLVAITFNHRSSQEHYASIRDAASDVDDLIQYVRENAVRWGIDGNRLAILAFSAGGVYGLRAALQGSPEYIQCAAAYYAVCDLLHLSEIPSSTLDEETLQEFSPMYFVNEFPERVPPLFFARAELDQKTINRSMERLIQRADDNGVTVELVTHQSAGHGFDIRNDDDTTREIIRRTIRFLQLHLRV